ncbi:MAG TPA: MlaD family protein [Pseudonocardia sp.]|nr:MlaD family protein [Pseudonocardia sp.]
MSHRAELLSLLGRRWQRVRTEPGLMRNASVTVGMVVIALVAGGIILSQQRFIAPWSHRYIVYATFEASPGVSPGQGQEVRIAGVQVGQIVSADVTPRGLARLELSLEPGHPVYDNASLVLRPKSPLNEMYVIMNPGGPPGRALASGDTLPVGNTQRPIAFDELLGNLDDNARTMLTSLLAESDIALTNAPKTLPPGLDAVRIVGNDLRPVSEELVTRKELLRRLVTSLAQISQAVGHDDKRLHQLGDGLQSTLGTLAANNSDVEATLRQLPDLLRQLRRGTDSVQGLADELDPALHNLQAASDDLPNALQALAKTSDRLSDVVDAAGPFVDSARPAVSDLRPFVADARRATPEVHETTRTLEPITRAALPYLPDIGAFIVQTRSLTSFTDANTGILRATFDASWQSLTPVNGPNNGIRPVPAPALDHGTTTLQKQIPRSSDGVPAPPQDGSRAGR